VALTALSLLAAVATAGPPAKPPEQQSGTELSSITIEAERDRAKLERRVKTFVSGITTAPYQDSLARWQKEMPICPHVAGLPDDDGEYMLSRLSQIANISGRSLTGILSGFPINSRAMNFRLSRDEVRDLTSVIVLIDARRLKSVTFGQLAAYIAMVGLAEVRLDANMGDAPSILQRTCSRMSPNG
jgi:hypothetical protein